MSLSIITTNLPFCCNVLKNFEVTVPVYCLFYVSRCILIYFYADDSESDDDDEDLFGSDDEETKKANEELKQKRIAEYAAKKAKSK